MKNEMKFNRINDIELDNVSGGTLTEVNQVADEFAKKGGMFGKIVADVHAKLNDKSGLAGPANILLRNAVSKGLSSMGISNDLSVGFLGTGGGSDPNKYSFGGKSISHAEVLNMIAAARVA